MDLSIIIVNYNVSRVLSDCLESILSEIKGIVFEIIVVDNNSSELSVLSIPEKFPEVQLIRAKKNLGFGRANNLGVDSAKGKYVLLLNPDTIVKENFILPIIKFMDEEEKAGACGPMLLNQDGSYQSSSGFRMGFLYDVFESFMIIYLYRKFKEHQYMKSRSVTYPMQIGWISAACMLLKKKVFIESGGFSPDYFLNYEDLELCRRLEGLGYRNYYFPNISCVHLDHKSFGNNQSMLVRSRHESRMIFAARYCNIICSIVLRLFMVISLISKIFFVRFGKPKELREQSVNGYFESLKLCFEKQL